MRGAALRGGAAALALALAACGAKTGLDAPDAEVDAAAPMDAAPPPPLCVEVEVTDPAVRVALDVPARLRVVDVMFLIDATASMQDEIDGVRTRLRGTVVPQIRALIPDAAFGVAIFGEFPVAPHGIVGRDSGPYLLRAPITTDIARVVLALEGTPVWGNADDPEAAIEGVYQVATGEGLSPWIAPSVGCATGGVGGGCFRNDAFRILMLVTDAPMNNGPPGVPPVSSYRFTPAPHTYDQSLAALRASDLFLIGLGATDFARPSPLEHLRALVSDSGSVDSRGRPLVFDIGPNGDAIGGEIVDAIRRVATDVPLDVDAAVEDVPGDAVDALDVVRGIRAVAATPPDAIGGMRDARFEDVLPGTRLTFELLVDASSLPPSTMRREYPTRVVFRASGRSRLDTRDVLVVVPGEDGGCDAALGGMR